ncbi:MAG TPA: class I SAM-dependent methyltransferase [Planctomycetota bacterium]|nr:class I SAM-dependent methyltransferase [Planctomycetota bacterium]
MSFLGLVERAYYLFHRRGDIVAKLLQHLPRPAGPLDVLDFGGGTGRVSRALAKAVPGRYTVADIDRSALLRAATSPLLRPILIPERGPLPFPSEDFDCVLVVDVLHHLPDASASLRELARCLRPGGRLLIVEFDANHPMTRLMRRLSAGRATPCTSWSPEGLSGLCRSLGLQTAGEDVDPLRFLIEASPGPADPATSPRRRLVQVPAGVGPPAVMT